MASPFSQRSAVAKAEIRQGDYIAAMLAMSPDSDIASDRPKVLKLLSKDKTFKSSLISQINSISDSRQDPFEQAAQAAILAERVGIFTVEERDAAIQAVVATFSRGVISGTLVADISVSQIILHSVNTVDVNIKLLTNSIRLFQHQRITDDEFTGLLDFAQTRDGSVALIKLLSDNLSRMNYRRAALLGSVATFDGKFAAKRLIDATTKIYFDLQSTDGLIPLDLKTALLSDEYLQVVMAAANADVIVKLRQLALVMEKLDESTQTVAYRQSQVNMLAAALLMPDNATYQFEYSRGGFQYEYAFSLTIVRNGLPGQETLIRDNGQLVWSECKNQRIVNVFGGIQPAGFVANREMQDMCGSTQPRVNLAAMRGIIVGKLASGIASVGLEK